MTVVSLPGRRAGLEFVEKFLTTNLTSMDTTEWNAGVLLTWNRLEPAC